jgi:hypothetical protein
MTSITERIDDPGQVEVLRSIAWVALERELVPGPG